MRAIDLCAGAGGASLGLLGAGYKVDGYDINRQAIATQKMNGLDCDELDIREADWRGITADCVWGSVPCQPFSQGSSVKKESDPRNLLSDWLRCIRQVKPRLVLFENVPGLARNAVRMRKIAGRLKSFGYRVDWKILNCADYGVPQSRKRMFLIARLDAHPVWPERHFDQYGTEGPRWITMAHGLGILPGWDWPLGMVPVTTYLDSQWIYDRPATTLTASFCPEVVSSPDFRRFDGPSRQYAPGAVRVTVGQAALLQGFPSSYHFVGTAEQQHAQIGNAVPPVMAGQLARVNRKSYHPGV